jgi:tetratricopeptide (TPR) repeat protein
MTLVMLPILAGCATLGTLETVEALLRQGKELYVAGRYDEALTKLQEVVRRDPRSWEGYLYLARIHIAKRSWLAAIENGRTAFRLAPTKKDVALAFGDALLGGGLDAMRRAQFREAIGHLVDYVRLEPGEAAAYLQLGRAYLETGAWADSLAAFGHGLGQRHDASLRRELLQGLGEGGTRALARGDPRSAIGFLQEYVRLDGGNISAHLDLGKAYWGAGETARAFGAFRRVLELSPGNEEALRFLTGAGR